MFRCFMAFELSLFLLGAGADIAWAQGRGGERSASAGHGSGHGSGHAQHAPGHGGHHGGHVGGSSHFRHQGHVGGAYRHSRGHYYPRSYGRTTVYRYPYSYGYGYGYGYPSYYDPYYPPPVYLPAEELYGPQSVMRFMGVNHWFRPKPNVNILVVPKPNNQAAPAAAAGAGGAAAAAKPAPQQRATNPKALALAWKFIGYGDAHFATQKYLEANARYRKAVRAAPQLAEGYFRQGYAYLAMGRHDLAADAIRRGLGLDPAWPNSGFSSAELYGDNDLAKDGHLDALAKASEESPNNADLLFLLGVFLHFDKQPDRAKAFFQRAAQLAGGNDGHIRAFLE